MPGSCPLEHHTFPLGQDRVRDAGQSADVTVFVWIDTRVVNHDVELDVAESRQTRKKRRQISCGVRDQIQC